MQHERAVLAANGVTYKVALKLSRDGYAVWAPELPGANSQGVTIAEALENIRDAIRELLAARRQLGWD
ncbi:MAG: type II toxin-antitoxin system HicB family antitoxin [Burkholderiales bacterium]